MIELLSIFPVLAILSPIPARPNSSGDSFNTETLGELIDQNAQLTYEVLALESQLERVDDLVSQLTAESDSILRRPSPIMD